MDGATAPNIKPLIASEISAALADLYKALKNLGFYPVRHPLRTKSLRLAHASLTSILQGQELTLNVTRKGFALAEGEGEADVSPMSLALAKELFLRRAQRLTFLGDLSLEDLSAFLVLLTGEPQRFAASGALEKEMAARRITTIWVNEIDLENIWAKREALEEAAPPPPVEEAPLPSIEAVDRSIEELIEAMTEEADDHRYLQLARLVTSQAEQLKEKREFSRLIAPMEVLMEHADSSARSVTQREYAAFSFDQLGSGAMTEFLLRKLENPDDKTPDGIHGIVTRMGAKIVYPIITRLCAADGLSTRKILASVLVAIGHPAISPIVSMLRDNRWYVVRNMVAILGEIGSTESIGHLKGLLFHSDQRVRKETIRALVKIGGREAESLIVSLLPDKDISIARQAILSLGIMKSQAAVQPLIAIISERDMFLSALQVKKEAVQALGRIGDKRAVPHLAGLLSSWHWLAWNRWMELKTAVATALGQLGDESALPVLKDWSEGSGHLARACNEAIDTIERLASDIYDQH
jgi:HEAT repeat protein